MYDIFADVSDCIAHTLFYIRSNCVTDSRAFFISLIGYIIDEIIFHGKSYHDISASVDYKHHVISWEIKHY